MSDEELERKEPKMKVWVLELDCKVDSDHFVLGAFSKKENLRAFIKNNYPEFEFAERKYNDECMFYQTPRSARKLQATLVDVE